MFVFCVFLLSFILNIINAAQVTESLQNLNKTLANLPSYTTQAGNVSATTEPTNTPANSSNYFSRINDSDASASTEPKAKVNKKKKNKNNKKLFKKKSKKNKKAHKNKTQKHNKKKHMKKKRSKSEKKGMHKAKHNKK